MMNKSKLQQIFETRKAVKQGKFVLASGKESDLYIDARIITLCTEGLHWIKKQFWQIVSQEVLVFDALGGLHTGADPIIGALLTNNKEPLDAFLWRKEVKKHGTQQEYEGTLLQNAKVMLIDDVATSGESLLFVANKIKQLHAEVVGAFVVVDREEGAKEVLKAQGIPLYSCLTRTQLLSKSS